LEIWGKRSPLSRWVNRPLLKELQFALHFDDPRLPDEEQITIRGDETQLEMLCDTVTNYVQNFLGQKFTQLTFSEASGASLTIAPQDSTTSTSDRSHTLAVVESTPQPLLSVLSSTPSLQPNGLLSHEFRLGALTTDSPQSAITLSALQLFDLASVLEEYEAEATLLPELDHPHPKQKILLWTGTAAALIFAVGVTSIAVKFYQTNQNGSTAALNKDALKAEQDRQRLTDVLPPVPPAPRNTPVPSPTLPPPLTIKRLPPPSPVLAPSAPSLSNSPTQGTTIAIAPNPRSGSSSAPPPPPVQGNGVVSQPLPSNSPSVISLNPNLPKLPSLQSPTQLAPELSGSESSPKASSNTNPPVVRRGNSETEKTVATNLLDTIPQVAQVREYFQQRWKPPEELKQTLEYQLVLNQDGSLARIFPLGQAAKLYLDRTNMPLLGESFVSPVDVSVKPKIRLVLNPDGTVKTFLEY
jgi:hypothetical protein